MTCAAVASGAAVGYFNSHPRVGGDNDGDDNAQSIVISIRTPAWGVTAGGDGWRLRKRNFNSHPRVGGDQVYVEQDVKQGTISIRTPAWGGDDGELSGPCADDYFNSHPRVGGDISRQIGPTV